jgi:hypothetical protein
VVRAGLDVVMKKSCTDIKWSFSSSFGHEVRPINELFQPYNCMCPVVSLDFCLTLGLLHEILALIFRLLAHF